MPKTTSTASASAAPARKASGKALSHVKIDCTKPVEDGIFDLGAFEKYLHDSIKIDGKTGKLGDTITIKRDATSVTISSSAPLSKRYMKFLTKRFVTKSTLKEFLRILSSNDGYRLVYFNVQAEDAEGGDQDEDEDM